MYLQGLLDGWYGILKVWEFSNLDGVVSGKQLYNLHVETLAQDETFICLAIGPDDQIAQITRLLGQKSTFTLRVLGGGN